MPCSLHRSHKMLILTLHAVSISLSTVLFIREHLVSILFYFHYFLLSSIELCILVTFLWTWIRWISDGKNCFFFVGIWFNLDSAHFVAKISLHNVTILISYILFSSQSFFILIMFNKISFILLKILLLLLDWTLGVLNLECTDARYFFILKTHQNWLLSFIKT